MLLETARKANTKYVHVTVHRSLLLSHTLKRPRRFGKCRYYVQSSNHISKCNSGN